MDTIAPLSESSLERLPPQSIEAEQAILGSILVNPETITKVCDVLQPDDFYRKAHQIIYAGILDLFDKGEPIDIVTVSQYLKDQGKLDSVGGRQYLTDLGLSISTTANAEYYAKTVNDKATLRNLIKAGTEIVGSCYEDSEADIVVDKAEQLIFNIAQHRSMSALVPIRDIVNESFARIEQRYEQRDTLSGLSTGFYDLDEMTSGWQRSDLIVLAARPSMGKCLSYDSEIVLVDGTVSTIGEIYSRQSACLLTVTDDLRLKWIHPSCFVDDGIKPVYKVTTRLGRTIETTLSHPFLTLQGWQKLQHLRPGASIAVPRHLPIETTGEARECEMKLLGYILGDGCITGRKVSFANSNPRIEKDFIGAIAEFGGVGVRIERSPNRTTQIYLKKDRCHVSKQQRELMQQVKAALSGSRLNQRQFSKQLSVTPGAVCMWLSGKTSISKKNLSSVLSAVGGKKDWSASAVCSDARDRVTTWLEDLGMLGQAAATKSIPAFVFRLKPQLVGLLLNRLFATDGWASQFSSGQPQIGFSTISERLAKQVQHLLLRFSIISKLKRRTVAYKSERRVCYQVEITDQYSLHNFIKHVGIYGKEAAVQRVAEALSNRRVQTNGDLYWDKIVSIEYAGEKQVYDLTIPDTHNFVANDICVHNTALALNMAQHAAVECKQPVAIFSLEMSKEQLVQRLLCAEARIDANKMRTGYLQSSDWQALAAAMGRLGEAPLYIDDSPIITALDIRAKGRRLKAEMKGLGLIVVDYIQLMQGRARSDGNRVQEVSEISRGLKQLARELDCPVIALSQLSRAVEARQNKRPMLSDLRESGSIEQDSDIVMFIYRDDYYNQESEKRGEAEIIIAKQRNGPVGTVELLYQASITRFLNKAVTNQYAQI